LVSMATIAKKMQTMAMMLLMFNGLLLSKNEIKRLNARSDTRMIEFLIRTTAFIILFTFIYIIAWIFIDKLK